MPTELPDPPGLSTFYYGQGGVKEGPSATGPTILKFSEPRSNHHDSPNPGSGLALDKVVVGLPSTITGLLDSRLGDAQKVASFWVGFPISPSGTSWHLT